MEIIFAFADLVSMGTEQQANVLVSDDLGVIVSFLSVFISNYFKKFPT